MTQFFRQIIFKAFIHSYSHENYPFSSNSAKSAQMKHVFKYYCRKLMINLYNSTYIIIIIEKSHNKA